jgi:hypothetical protein
MDLLVERLIAEETINGESFRAAVAAWEAEQPQLPAVPAQLDSLLAAGTSGEADIKAAKVRV